MGWKPPKKLVADVSGGNPGRVVHKNCVDQTKANLWYGKLTRVGKPPAKLEPLTPFLPTYNFETDDEYLTLSQRLSFRDLELSKYIAAGYTATGASKAMYPHMPLWMHQSVQRVYRSRQNQLMPLIEYFKRLLGFKLNPTTFSMDEALRNVLSGIRHARPGKEQVELTLKLIELTGMTEDFVKYARGKLGKDHGHDKPSLERAMERIATPDDLGITSLNGNDEEAEEG